MQAQEVRCPSCYAPVAPTNAGFSSCRFCGATLALQGAPQQAPQAPHGPLRADVGAAVFLEDAGDNKIGIIKIIREHTGCGLREAKDLMERAPCVVADWPGEPLKMLSFCEALRRGGARVR